VGKSGLKKWGKLARKVGKYGEKWGKKEPRLR
jgi:hypothetical protein